MMKFHCVCGKLIAGLLLAVLLLTALCAASADEPVPFLSDLYPGSSAHLRLNDNLEFRVGSYAGPGRDYAECGGYKPYKQQRITVYFVENNWVMADISYQTAEERFVYFPLHTFDSINCQEVSQLRYFDGTITENVHPSWGPNSSFNTVKSMAATAGTAIRVYFQENGYVYGEYRFSGGKARMWFPADKVSIPGATLSYTDEPSWQTGRSSFGLASSSSSGSLTTTCPMCGQTMQVTVQAVICDHDANSPTVHACAPYVEQICHNCGYTYYGYDYNAIHDEPHNFVDGVCTECGYSR